MIGKYCCIIKNKVFCNSSVINSIQRSRIAHASTEAILEVEMFAVDLHFRLIPETGD